MMDSEQRLLPQIVGHQLFGGKKPEPEAADPEALLREARLQTVYLSVFPFLGESLKRSDAQSYEKHQQLFWGSVMTNTNNFMEHDELHRLMTDNGIRYCALKGIASAYYYPEPSLREMGDVDFLIAEADFERAKSAVLGAGFEVDHGESADSLHIAFKREPSSIWEQHRSLNGIPEGAVGDLIKEEIGRVIDTAEPVTVDGATCLIPDTFHHGLILLLHMASHLTSEGIGLRHLCDWAVFADSMESDAFAALFETKLKRFGLWRFAQMMTLASERYLGSAPRSWARNDSVTDEQLEEIMTDILNGGNFGKKDLNRYREIKYISNRGERTVDRKSVLAQAFCTLNRKVFDDYPRIAARKAFLPVGWFAEGVKYVGLLITGKRKTKGTSSMLREASRRKSIYSRMELFRSQGSDST